MSRFENTFGETIRKKRLELEKTQAALAKELGVSQNFVTYLESGQRKPSDEMVGKLAKALKLPHHTLYLQAHPEVKNLMGLESKELSQLRMSPVLASLAEDAKLRKRYAISDAEIDQLASLRLRGEVKSKEDYAYLLMSIRQVLK